VSDYLAVGGVSVVLRSLLTTALTVSGPSSLLGAPMSITATSPDLVPTGANENPRLNLFMYYASPNAAYRNFDFPAYDSAGRRISNPPLALDLHYLLTAYGSTQFDPEILLGWAMQVFHEMPIVSRETVQDALTALGTATPESNLLSKSTLANQMESLRITPESLSNDDISRLWMAFQTNYRPTASYLVTVVLIQGTQAVKSNLPVQTRTLIALPLQPPVIDSVSPVALAPGEMLTIAGSNFIGDALSDTLVAFDQGSPVTPDTIQPNLIRVKIPSTLPAGGRTVRILRRVSFGVSTDPHKGFSSHLAAFQVVPTLSSPPANVAAGTTLTLTITPDVGNTQKAILYLGDFAIRIDDRAATGPASSSTLGFPIPSGFAPGNYPLRVSIDGADSRLVLDTTQGSASFGQFLPQITVTP
jgi:hypothetical protein